MSAGSFELVLRRLANAGHVDPRPQRSPDTTTVLACQSAREFQLQPASDPSNSDGDYCLRIYLSYAEIEPPGAEATDNPRVDLHQLLEASRSTLQKIAATPVNSGNSLHRLRVHYARTFHPDRLPRDLHQIANAKMAEINARVDAALSADFQSVQL